MGIWILAFSMGNITPMNKQYGHVMPQTARFRPQNSYFFSTFGPKNTHPTARIFVGKLCDLLNRNQSPQVDTRHKPSTQHALLSQSTKPGNCVKIWSARWIGQRHCTVPLGTYEYMRTTRTHVRLRFPGTEKHHTWRVPEDQIQGARRQERARELCESQVLASSLI
jgi:hypothetical protein